MEPEPITIAPAIPREEQAVPAPQESGPAMTRPLRIRDFRLIFSGETVSLLGDQFHFIALAWLALQLTGSGLALGTVLMTAGIPRAVFMLVGGAFSDRFSPRTLMLFSNAIRSVVVAVLAVLVITGNAQLWQLYVLAAIFGLVDAFFHPALNTIVPMLVPEGQLPAANALIQGTAQLTGLFGPAIAGFVIAAVQTGPAFAVDAVSFAVATAALVAVTGGRRATTIGGDGAQAEQPSMLATIREGIAYAWAHPAIRSLLVLIAAFNFAFTGPVNVGLAWIARSRFGGSADFGLMLSAFGAGALVGAVVAGSIKRVPNLGGVTMAIAGLLGLGLAGIGFAPNLPILIVVGIAMGLGVGFINVRTIAWVQAEVPDALTGRVMSLVMFGSQALGPFSLALAGAIIDLGAVTVMFTVAGVIVVLAALSGIAWGVPRLMNEPA
jgi:MFS family permease